MEENNITEEVKPKKSNGKIYKEKNGHSKSMRRLMFKHKVETIEEYRLKRKEWRKKINHSQALKRSNARVGRISSKNSKTSKNAK